MHTPNTKSICKYPYCVCMWVHIYTHTHNVSFEHRRIHPVRIHAVRIHTGMCAGSWHIIYARHIPVAYTPDTYHTHTTMCAGSWHIYIHWYVCIYTGMCAPNSRTIGVYATNLHTNWYVCCPRSSAGAQCGVCAYVRMHIHTRAHKRACVRACAYAHTHARSNAHLCVSRACARARSMSICICTHTPTHVRKHDHRIHTGDANMGMHSTLRTLA